MPLQKPMYWFNVVSKLTSTLIECGLPQRHIFSHIFFSYIFNHPVHFVYWISYERIKYKLLTTTNTIISIYGHQIYIEFSILAKMVIPYGRGLRHSIFYFFLFLFLPTYNVQMERSSVYSVFVWPTTVSIYALCYPVIIRHLNVFIHKHFWLDFSLFFFLLFLIFILN